jgi:hypothetical protein
MECEIVPPNGNYEGNPVFVRQRFGCEHPFERDAHGMHHVRFEFSDDPSQPESGPIEGQWREPAAESCPEVYS